MSEQQMSPLQDGSLSAGTPPVVAVVVIHQPGPWLAESLRALAAQDYPALQILALVSGTEDAEGARSVLDVVETELPGAVVRFTGGNAGFAASANLVLNLVQGDSGFFCFLHDDVALMPGAVSALVDELYRSNAGLVAPKLVNWDDPREIHSVGIAVDKFGVELPVAEDGEVDQEQHDAVQDVFAVSTACMLIRADLFRAIGGFNPRLALWGADIDVCWRSHAAAARVVVVPAAVARHRASMTRSGATDLVDHIGRREAARMQTVASLTTGGQLPATILQMIVLSLVRTMALLVTGRLRHAGAQIQGLFSLAASVREIRSRRASLARYRAVSGAEVRALQLRGTAYVASYLRRRARRSDKSASHDDFAVRETTPRSSLTLWVALVFVLLVGSRSLILDGLSAVGQFVPIGDGPRGLVVAYSSGWWGAGFGQVSSLPTGIALAAAAGVAVAGHMELLRTLSVVLLPLLGWIGMWRFASVFGSRASRIAGVVAYAAVPLPYASIAAGRWGALLMYACIPWMAHHGRILVGHSQLSEVDGASDEEFFEDVAPTRWRRSFAALCLINAVCFAFEPAVVLVMLMLVTVWASVTIVHSGLIVRAMRWPLVGAGAMFCALCLNLPWTATYVRGGWWEALVGAPVEGGRDWGLVRLASFGVGNFVLSFVCLALYAAVAGAVLLVRGAKTPWALRGVALTAATLLLVLLDDAVLLPFHLPEPAVMLSLVAFGLAVSASAMGAMLVADLGRGRFSWRQPLGALLALVFIVGLVPAPINAIGGGWNQSTYSLPRLLAQLPSGDGTGDYRTLFLGDARVLPGAPLNFGWGIGYSVVNGPSPALTEMWEIPPNRLRDETLVALYGIVRGRTARAGRLLAPLAVRYIVVPQIDGAASTRREPIAVPRGLIDALSRQLDLRRKYASPDMVVFENTAWVPVRSQLTAEGSAASARAGAESMITEDISGAAPIGPVGRTDRNATFEAAAGTVHFAVPYTPRWTVTSAGRTIESRPAFGLTNAFDLSGAGQVELSFSVSTIQTALVLAQMVAWCLFLFMLVDRGGNRRGMPRGEKWIDQRHDAPVFSMNEQGPT